ncbi:MAG: DEAD/DEAH box helicase [Bdellovibrionales bacterium]|jgi:ATP-dependent RNA helicase DeaD|nr:DEAD/DEAH box helicase [Bdellovibrionales bacterium]
MKFKELNLSSTTLKGLEKMGFETPTEIQRLTITHLLQDNKDFVGQAQTGTGKTAAFCLPLIEYLKNDTKPLRALILAPTRELAHQIAKEFDRLAYFSKLKAAVVVGGESYDKQISKIKSKGANVVIGTPGRVIDLMKRKVLSFKESQYLILDEADEMLKMGFYEAIQEIIKEFNKNRYSWMFSATMPKEIKKLIQSELKDPHFVNVTPKSISKEEIEQSLYLVKERFHLEALTRLIKSSPDMYAMVFCQTKRQCDEYGAELIGRGYKAEILHGDMGQGQRNRIMTAFKAKKVPLLICTDVAARGIDVSNLSHVINIGVPREVENYIHRIGRTGRAGEKGIALSIVDVRDLIRVRAIEKHIGRKLNVKKLPTVDALKTGLVEDELTRMETLVSAISGKKEKFKIDPTFKLYNQELGHLSKDDILKLTFSWMFNRDLRRFDDLSQIEQNIEDRMLISRKRNRKRGSGGPQNAKKFNRNRTQRKTR